MRIDMRLGFAIGFSGGGKAAWNMAYRYSQHFAGVVMMGINCVDDHDMLSPHIRVGYIHGEHDFNNDVIAMTIPYVQAHGNPVREMVIPGGHVPGNAQQISEMLDWMLSDARNSFGIPLP